MTCPTELDPATDARLRDVARDASRWLADHERIQSYVALHYSRELVEGLLAGRRSTTALHWLARSLARLRLVEQLREEAFAFAREGAAT